MFYKTIVRILVLAAVLFTACGEPDGPKQATFDREPLLRQLADSLIIPAYTTLEASLTLFDGSLNAFLASPSLSSLESAQNDLNEVRLAWQAAAFYDFGPALDAGLLSAFNIFPTDTPQMESNIAAGSWDLEMADQLDAQGLPAFDYLLNRETASVVADFSSAGSANRVQYAHDLYASLENRLATVLDMWTDSYRADFLSRKGVDAGSSVSLYVNSLNKYLERDFRDGKIGIPAGIRSLGVIQPDKTEAYWSGESVELALVGLSAIQQAFNGSAGVGLDDYLDAIEAQRNGNPLSSEINALFEEAIIGLQLLEGAPPAALSQLVQSSLPKVLDIYQQIQALIVPLKIDLPSATGILITYTDNDGD